MASNSTFASGRDQQPEIRRRNVAEVAKGDKNVPSISVSDTKGVTKVREEICSWHAYILIDKSVSRDKGKSFLDILDEWEFVIAPVIFTALSFFTRMYRIGLSNIVTWDEAQYVHVYLLLSCLKSILTMFCALVSENSARITSSVNSTSMSIHLSAKYSLGCQATWPDITVLLSSNPASNIQQMSTTLLCGYSMLSSELFASLSHTSLRVN
jgi:hypothetical protein